MKHKSSAGRSLLNCLLNKNKQESTRKKRWDGGVGALRKEERKERIGIEWPENKELRRKEFE
jgi:hypothetical protein